MKLVVLCGGSGTRLWPISRTSSPKQFAQIFNKKSLYEHTIERNKNIVDGFIIVVNEKQLHLCKEQLPSELKDNTQFIIESSARNTAPAITLAAILADGEDLMIVPSDHLIDDLPNYQDCIKQAQILGKNNKLITFGLRPQHPETGFGYIEAQGNHVKSFKEKPDLETAKEYVSAGNFYWNSGMFYFNSQYFLEELTKHQKDIYERSLNAFKNAIKESNTYFIQKDDMEKIPSISIDYAVMEKSSNVAVVAAHYKWADLGSFDALYDILPKDESKNTIDENYIQINSKNNLIIGDKRVITTFDVEDLIIVDTKDALLIGKKGESQRVKDLLAAVKAKDPKLLG
jgi:mannose-1-phosphate guanylyltransferase